MTMAKIGKRLRERRHFLKVTQYDLAEIAGVSIRSLKAIEKGDGNPNFNQLNKILDALGLKVTIEERLNEK